ncbi:MAG: hypothetical protein V1736_07415, partial [Pseudomonadota bacterium]
HLVIGLIALDIRGGVKDEFALGVLGKESKGALHPFSSGTGPMGFKHRLIAKVGNCVKVEIDDASIAKAKPQDLADELLLQAHEMDVVQRVGVSGESRTFRQGVESREKPQAGIEGVFPHMGIALGAEELQGEKGEEIVPGRNALAFREAGSSDHLVEAKLSHEGSKQEHPSPGRLQALALKHDKLHWLGALGKSSTFDGTAYFELGPAGKLGEALFGQDTLDGSYGNIYSLFAEQLRDIASGKILPAPGNDFPSGLGTDFPSGAATFGGRFGEVNLAVAELMPHNPQIANAETKALSKKGVRQSFNEGGPQGFVPPLPVGDGPGKKGSIFHARSYS